MKCSQCQMVAINGVPCHEHGCPNMGAKWEGGTWVKYHECGECGSDVPDGEPCGCDVDDWEPEAEEVEAEIG